MNVPHGDDYSPRMTTITTRAPNTMSFLTSTSTLRVAALSRLSLHRHCLRLSPLRTTPTFPQRAMTTRDVSIQSDIAKSFASHPKDSDGSFNRRPSSFRDTIAKGSKYEPEKGMTAPPISPISPANSEVLRIHYYSDRAVPPLRLLRLSMGPPHAYHADSEGPGGLHRCYRREPSHGRARMAICRL